MTDMDMLEVISFIMISCFLYILGTYILVRFYFDIIARLLAVSVFLSAVGYTFEFIFLLFPTELSRFVILSIFSASFVLIMQIFYEIIKTMKPNQVSRLPYIYGGSLLFLSVHLFLQLPLFDRMGKLGIISFIPTISMCAFIITILYLGYKNAISKEYRLFFQLCLMFTVIIVTFAVLGQCGVIDMPTNSGLMLTALTGTLISYLIVKLNLVTSTVKRYADLINSSATPMVILDENLRVLEVNEIGKVDYKIGVNSDFRDLFNYQNEPTLLDQLFARLDEKYTVKGFRIDYVSKEGVDSIVLIDASKVSRPSGAYYYCMIHEVTLEFQRRHLNEHLAYHDVLTGIYNRAYFEEEVKRKLKQTGKKASALMICDLNFFKEINDTYGHQTGDNVLVFTANCWSEHLPKPNILARLGGDEFVMFFEEIESKEQFIKQINDARNSFQFNLYKQDDIEIEIVPSVGVAFASEDGKDYERLYQTCDVRMYEDKKIVKEHYL